MTQRYARMTSKIVIYDTYVILWITLWILWIIFLNINKYKKKRQI